MSSRPRIFIGSSVEGLRVAEHIQLGLDYDADCTVWSQGVFGLSGGTLESLCAAIREFDFAVLVLTPDDLVQKRSQAMNSPRDNVLFELGLFMGALGRERTFIVYCRDEPIGLPSDLAGVTAATFARRADGNLQAALGSVCTLIRNAVGKQHGRAATQATGPSTLASEVAALRVALEAQTESFRQVLAAATNSAATPEPAGARPGSASIALRSLGGIWHDTNSGTVVCVKFQGGDLRLIYRFRSDPNAAGEYYNVTLLGDALLGRYRWMNDLAMKGYFYLKIEAEDRLSGGWCPEHEAPPEGIEALPQHLDGLVPMVWHRQKPVPPFPPWAVRYFETFGRE
ncbi:TIR domain-containing protein [Sorangium sp. So ce1000]|uniref:TIR domain-containing protein n=1 Tax=Sorangium sp. So ce1000 TaxID=3133325 RepID=UPI003F61E1E1